jgi:uncharacterized protein YidB (DUF937 family)
MKRFWKLGIVAVVLLALGGIAAGIVAAQTSGGTATPSASSSATPAGKQALLDDFLTRLAANLGISVDQLKAALTTTDNQMLDQALADGKITQAEADKIKARIASGHLFPFVGRGRGHGRGFGLGFEGENLIGQTATFLSITSQAVIDGLNNNQSLEQIAEANGKTAGALSGYLNDQLKSNLDTAVKNGKITQAQEDKVLTNAKDRIDQAVNHVGPLHGPRDWGDDKGAPSDNGTPSDSTPSGTANPTSL